MKKIEQITGRLGNQMFQYASLVNFARKLGVDTYFQSEEWFKDSEQRIKELYGTDIEPLYEQVAIHVRRGDYTKEPHKSFHSDLFETDYYQKAIDLFPDKNFLIFSDDIKWCLEQPIFQGKRFTPFHSKDPIKSMNVMASCDSNIIANSTFSYWGAWLNKNPNKKVVAPREDKWFRDGIIRIKLPKEWIQV